MKENKFLLLAILFACILAFLNRRLNDSPIVITSTDLIEVIASDTVQHQAMNQFITSYKAQKDANMNVVIGSCSEQLNVHSGEKALRNIVADMMLYVAQENHHADMAITNTGGIRRNLFAGNITIGDIYEILPFDNSLVILEYKGADLLDLADAVAAKGGEALSGMSLDIVDGKAENVMIAGAPIDTTRTYQVVTTDYLSWGNDNLTPLSRHINSTALNMMMRDAMIKYVKEKERL
ncbi:MAG: 5'-nucleotidase C-terminal domain-containing protein [bacterium]